MLYYVEPNEFDVFRIIVEKETMYAQLQNIPLFEE